MNQKEKTQLIAEFRILKSLVHPNIVQYYHHEHMPEEHAVHLYMEYCGGGDLAGIIQTCKETGEYVPESMVWAVFTQLTLALYRCHYNSDPPPPGELFNSNDNYNPPQPATVILHRDIKPDNVFLDQNNSVKLGDFGLAKILDQDHFMANTYVGTPYYMSPEVLLDRPFTPQSDIWSLGCVIYELCSKHPPFQAKTHLQLSQKIREGVYPPLPSVYSATLSKTIAACLNMNYLQRPTTSTLLRLDVMKLCQKEREVAEAQREVLDIREQILMERENVMKQLQMEQEQQQMQMFQQINEEFNMQLEQEVQRRVTAIMQDQSMNMMGRRSRQISPERTTIAWQASDIAFSNNLSPISNKPYTFTSALLSSPSDVVMTSAQNTPVPPRNVKGPRTIRDHSLSPSFNDRSPLKSMHFEEIEYPSFKSPTLVRNNKYNNSMLAAKSASMDNSYAAVVPREQLHKRCRSTDSDLDGARFSVHKYPNEDGCLASSSASVSTYSSLSSHFSSSSEVSQSSYELDPNFEYSSSQQSHNHSHNHSQNHNNQNHNNQNYSQNHSQNHNQNHNQNQNRVVSKEIPKSPQITPASMPTTPRERQAPHFQAVYEAKKSIVSGVGGAPPAKAKVMRVKGPGTVGRHVLQTRTPSQGRRDGSGNLNGHGPTWDEVVYGAQEEIPSPFLKREERRRQ